MEKLTLKQIRLILIIILLIIYVSLEIYIVVNTTISFENPFTEVLFYLSNIMGGTTFFLVVIFLCDYLAHKITHTEF